MNSQHDSEIKKPTPRRLFSIDNLKSSDSSNKKRPPQHQESPSWITSPEGREQLTSSPVQDAPPASQKDLRKVFPFVNTHTPRSGSADSGSLSRWESIREHVLAAGAGRAATPPLLSPPSLPFSQSQRSRSPYGHQQQASTASSALSFPASSSLPTTRPPSRSQTPKPGSRLAARLGFRNVVDHAREAAVDENRKLSEDILRACWATRHIDPNFYQHQHHPAKANLAASSSGLHLPFTKTTMSSFATAASGSAASVATGFSSKKSDQPQSYQGSTSYSYSNPFASNPGLASGSSVNVGSSSGGGGQYAGSSVKLLHKVLWQASGSTTATLRSVYLPHENLVLSALLSPFLILNSHVQGVNAAHVEEERWLAIDAFELLVKTWPPANETASAERCMWCTKAAMLPPSPLRSRILSTLWGLTTPSENNHIFLSPDAIQSLANGLFSLLPVIASQPQLQSDYQTQLQGGGMQINSENDSSGDLRILKEVMDHLSEGPVDEDALEVEYNSKWDIHGGDNAEGARKLILSESCVCCLEMCERDARIWLMQHAIEDYWPQLSEHPTQFQRAVFSRYIIHFCNGALSLLTLPPYEIRHDLRTSLTNKIIRVVERLVTPEVSAIHDKGKAKERGKSKEGEKMDVGFKMRKAVVRVVVEVLCCGEDVHDESARWAASAIAKWWTDGVWKEAFEEMLKDVVANAEWGNVVNVLTGIINRTSDGIRKAVVASIFSHLTDRLVQDPPPPALLTQPSESSETHSHNRSSSALSYISYNQYSPNQINNSLTTLLHTLSQLTPQIFFKPLFTLAASNRELTIANVLCVVCVLERIVKDWWVRDAEMIGVALMNIGNHNGSEQGKAGRLGQVVVLIELVGRLRVLRRLRDSVGNSNTGSSVLATALGSDAARLNLIRFVTGLELRLAALIEAKEKVSQIPPTQRMLICMLFREFRLLTRSLKPAPWLPTVLRWFKECYQGGDHEEEDQEVKMRLGEIQALYELAKGNASSSHKRRTFVVTSNAPSNTKDKDNKGAEDQLHVPDILNTGLKLIASLFKGFVPRALKLLVTVSAILNPVDWGLVAPIVWSNGLDVTGCDSGGGLSEKGVIPLICFLVMQCAEKNPLEFRAMVEVDMRSSDDRTRLESINKLNLLINWRFQIMPEPHSVLADRTHRLFKFARAPLPFVPADMGSVNYVHDNSTDTMMNKTKRKDGIPAELRRQLIEIGWVGEDTEGDEKEVWVRTPVSMLPVGQVERLDIQRSDHSHIYLASRPPSPSAVPNSPRPVSPSGHLNPVSAASPNLKPDEGGLLRRNSSAGGPTYAKRRAVFVPALSPIFRGLAMMVYDSNFTTAIAARETLLDLMRNDPGLLLRPILDLLCEEQGQDNSHKDVSQAVNIFTALLHAKHMLPPPMTHAIFNNLAGFLKYASRQTDPSLSTSRYLEQGPTQGETLLTSFALTVPIMAQLAKYVGELTIREIRRSKMEHFLIPYGTLWFDHAGMHSGPMFPKGPSPNSDAVVKTRQNPFEAPTETELDTKLVNVVMIRIAQNMMFVDMLKKNPQDVALVRKTMPRFVVPRLDGNETEGDEKVLSLNAFVPFRKLSPHPSSEGDEKAAKTLEVLSLALARSYVTLVGQVFRCMSRNSNDREEMANFVDGLNRILLIHGDDIGIIGHVLIAFMVASARFRRLFTSSGGYALFVPALVKIYADFYDRTDIKLAIEYAVYRFYALHREAFLFQSLDAIAHVAALPETDISQYAAKVYELFYSLRTGVTPTNTDPAGIHDVNQSQEKEAMLIHIAEDKPQTLLAAIRRGDAQTNGQIFFDVPDSLENSRLRMEDFVKLFLTIIAHDPSILRAQHFMRIFRFLAPHLYNASPQARNVLQEGLAALSEILIRAFSKSKLADGAQVGEADAITPNIVNESESGDKSKNASNPVTMRLDFLFALTTVAQAGSHIPPQMSHQAIEIAKIILKDTSVEMFEPLSTFFGDLTKLVVLRGELSKLKYVIPFLQEMSPVIRTYSAILDFTPVFEAIAQVSSTLPYSNDQVFSRVAVHELCSAGFEACELVAAETERSNMHFRKALVTLLCEGVFLRGADVLGELEKRRPSFALLAKVVLPLCLTLRTTDQLTSDTGKSETWHRSFLARSWIRLLFYAMTACQRSFRAADNLPLSRSKSRDKKNTDEKQWQAHSPTFVTALQVIKVIVIRAEAEISTTSPDLWHRLAGFLRSVLMDGNAHFALPSSNLKDFSPLPSPTPSPRGSIQLDHSGQPSFFDLPRQSTITSGVMAPPTPPRVIDYALWSTLEFLCAYRSPLRLQLRLFTMEKVVTLDQELGSLQRRTSPFVSPSISPVSRRISVFAKPRRSALFPSPDSSPRTSRPPSVANELSIPSIHLGPNLSRTSHGHLSSLDIPDSNSGGQLRIPGYQYNSPISPASTPKRGGAYIQADGDQNHGQGPRIVHLGPASPAALLPPTPVSPGGGGSFGVSNIRLMAQSTKISSSTLVRATCRRIRAVQTFMGYDTLLPMPTSNPGIVGLGGDGDEVSFVTWTKRSALEAVLNEMKELEEEFEDIVRGDGNSSGGRDMD